MLLGNMKIRARLALGFGIVLMLLGVVIIAAVWKLNAIDTITHTMIDEDWVKTDSAAQVSLMMQDNGRRTLETVLNHEPADLARNMAAIEKNKNEITAHVKKLDALIHLENVKAMMTQYKEQRKQYVTSFSTVLNLVKEGKQEEARALVLNETLPALEKSVNSITNVYHFQQELAQQTSNTIENTIDFTINFMIVVGVLAIVIGIFFAVMIARTVINPINEAVKVAQTVANGNLTSRIQVTSKDETGDLLKALQSMNGNLIGIVSQVRNGTAAIASASQEIASGTLDLSSRTEEQASSLEETASSMEELTSTVKQNALNAQQANNLAIDAAMVANDGRAVMNSVVETMDAINASSSKIADIIDVINGIAFQTNILALNAAVEAARAGEQGRGFAVVASEVRTLAQRSSSAAKEIKELIDDSVSKVGTGTQLVGQAGTTMQKIVHSIDQVKNLISEISSASAEQTSGIEQINQSVMQMDNVTQQNASLVEEAAAASESLQEQAEKLKEMVQIFQLDNQHAQGSYQAKPAAVISKPKIVPANYQKPVAPVTAKQLPAVAKKDNDDDWTEF
jgi:methyl-accepting chemotaxis protein